jgi:DnaD/phage-associated family protein
MLPIANCSPKEEEEEKDINKEKEKDEEEEKEKDKEEEKDKQLQQEKEKENVFVVFESNFHTPSSMEVQRLVDFQKDFGNDLLLKALEIAVENNIRTIAYITGILNDWEDKGIKTLSDVEAQQREWQNKKNNRGNG